LAHRTLHVLERSYEDMFGIVSIDVS